jgi:hypothetical protein
MHSPFHTLAWLFLAGSCVGCQHLNSESYPKDPLLVAKKPVEGSPAPPAPPVQVVSAEPVVPPVPVSALATAMPQPAIHASRTHETFAAGRQPINAQATSRESGLVVATPAVRSTPPAPAASVYGHAPDHSWLVGVLDKHYMGHFALRYCDASEDDSWGGKVSLDNDPRLAQFQDGDVVRIEGELVPRETGQRDTWSHYPHYHIRDVKLIQRQN